MRDLFIVPMTLALCAAATAAAQPTLDPPGAPSDGGVQPVVVDGNPNCAALGYANGFKIDADPAAGVYTIVQGPLSQNGASTGMTVGTAPAGAPTPTITITRGDANTFDFTSNRQRFLAVIVKGGSNANSFVYVAPGTLSDGALHAPLGGDGNRDISHVEFCWDTTTPPPPPLDTEPLTITKDGAAGYTRTHVWDIKKWASSKAGWDRKDGSVAVDYFVKVTKTSTQTNGAVTGGITVRNPNTLAFDVKVVDTMAGASCTVEGDGTATIPAGGLVTFRYVCSFPDPVPTGVVKNVATASWKPAAGVTANPPKVTEGTAEVEVDFAKATVTDLDGAVKVTDTIDGDQTRVLAAYLTEGKTFRYTRYLRAAKKCRTFHNVARLVGLTGENGTATARMVEGEYALTRSDEEWVRICPPPAPKGESTTPAPPKVEVGSGDGPKGSAPAEVTPVDNPKGPVITNPKATGRLVVSKWITTKGRVHVGDIVTWRIRIGNTGKADLSEVALTDLLPRHLAPVTDEASRRTSLTLWAGTLTAGQSKAFTVQTRVLGRPVATPAMVRQAKRIAKAKDRNEALRRLRRGLICNVAVATARNAKQAKAVSCIRVARPRPEPTG